MPRPGLSLWIATAGGVGFGPWAPGTWGALLAVVLYLVVLERLPFTLFVLIGVLVTAAGIWASDAVEDWFGKSDDGRIVVDEVAGQWIALFPVAFLNGLPLADLPILGIDAKWFLVVTAFVAFRWFDIRKPGPVKWAEKNFKGGLGVMADDVVAGILAAIVVMVPAFLLVTSSLESSLVGGAG